MPIIRPETRRLIVVVLKLAPIALRYRSDRKEIKRAEGKLVHPEKYQRHAIKAVDAFIDLGPAFIKLGQLLSVRPDILPQPYIDQFARLQDEVPPAPFNEVKPVIEQEIGPIERTFDSFDPKAVTGASLGQVYQARYQGKEVVVKVNRPNIREKMTVELKVLQRLVPLVGRFIDQSLRFSMESVVSQFSDTIKEEMDYKNEAHNLLTIKRNLRDDKTVIIPDLYPQISTEKVLVLQYVGGIKVNDINALDQANVDRRKLARRVARLFFKMLLSQDVFHADPHPGNISIKTDGKIVLYDFGMAATLDEETRVNLVRFYTALVDNNPSRIVQVMLELGILEPQANRWVITRGVELALADMRGKKVEESEVKALMEVANRTIYQFPFKLPKNLVLYMRMLSILEGVCLKLDPDFRFIKILGRLLEEEGLMEEAYSAEIREQIKRLTQAIDSSIEIAPMLKNYLEYQQQKEFQGNPGRKRNSAGFFPGALVGFGILGVITSIFFVGSESGKIEFIVSLVVFVAGLFFARR
jgi:predicted unusual protein kinase regulating ubiquinone biosynthesis (AarF/ABC1/UbiB family)